MMVTEEQPFALLIRSFVLNDLDPHVLVEVVGRQPNGDLALVAAIKLDTVAARQHSMELQFAAEAAEAQAHTVLALREQKTPEEIVQAVLERIKERRA